MDIETLILKNSPSLYKTLDKIPKKEIYDTALKTKHRKVYDVIFKYLHEVYFI